MAEAPSGILLLPCQTGMNVVSNGRMQGAGRVWEPEEAYTLLYYSALETLPDT